MMRILCLMLVARAAAAQVTVELGPPEMVLDPSAPSTNGGPCELEDISDIPARAFVDAAGQVHLLAGHFEMYRSIGDNLADVARDCGAKVMTSHHDGDPEQHNDAEWLHGVFTHDGTNVHALVHNEYHGWEHANCNNAEVFNCWWNSISYASSSNGGNSYSHATAPTHAVCLPTHAYDPDNTSGPFGFFNPSNLFEHDGWIYTMIQAEQTATQDWGVCIMRTQALSDPTSWRFWDGSAWNGVPRGDGTRGDPCPVISRATIGKMHAYTSFNNYLGRWLTVGEHNIGGDWGFYYALSDDLLAWDSTAMLMDTELWWTGTSADQRRGYPATLQPGDPTRNFQQTGRSPWLYYTRWRPNDGTYVRYLMRRRVRFSLPTDVGRYQVLALEMNEHTGARTLDSSFYGNDGTLQGAAFASERATGPSSLYFASDGDRVVVSDDVSLRLTGDLSIEAFVRVGQLHASNYGAILTKDNGPAARNYAFYVAPATSAWPGRLHFSATRAGDFVGTVGNRNVADGHWHHVAVTYDDDPGVVTYYVDGRIDAQQSFRADLAAATSTVDVLLGQSLQGWLDSVRLYNYVRAADEVAAAAVGSGNVEICNGVDDTGEGNADEGFACTVGDSQSEACPGGCADRTRACHATNCTWMDWSTCPACDDGGETDGGPANDGGFEDEGSPDSGPTPDGAPSPDDGPSPDGAPADGPKPDGRGPDGAPLPGSAVSSGCTCVGASTPMAWLTLLAVRRRRGRLRSSARQV